MRYGAAIIALTLDFNDRTVRCKAAAFGDFLDVAGKLFVKMFGDIAAVVANGEHWRVAVLVLAAGGPGVQAFQTVDEPKLVATVTENTNAGTGVLDPLGASIKDGPDLYFTLIRNMAKSLKDCLVR